MKSDTEVPAPAIPYVNTFDAEERIKELEYENQRMREALEIHNKLSNSDYTKCPYYERCNYDGLEIEHCNHPERDSW